jgi:biopolymer transport protein TolQ
MDATPQATQSLWQLVYHAVEISGGFEKAILVVLAALSVLSWALILYKVRLLRRTAADNARFLDVFAQAQHTGTVLREGVKYPNALMFTVFQAGIERWRSERASPTVSADDRPSGEDLVLRTPKSIEEKVLQSMQHASQEEFSRMLNGLDVLATIGSSSPFIGLLGTVWGIMATFQALSGAKSASLQVVAPGIASALIATAVGLFVAIPAVAAYNWIMARLDDQRERTAAFIEKSFLLLQSSGGLSPEKGAAKK